MTNENRLILEIWETFRDLVPPNKREDAAFSLLRICVEYGFDDNIVDLEGEDHYLDLALEGLADESEEEIDDFDEE